jgi:hypothetical protein
MKLPIAAALVLAFLPACLENEEQLTVRPDGSCSVRVKAKGEAPDFAEGYPIPTGLEWKVERADVPEYLGWVRTGMKSEELRSRLPQDKQKNLEFELAGEFASVRQLPKYYASGLDPYRTAYLARATELKVEPRGSKTLYSFERRFGAREYARFDSWSRMQRALPGELVRRIDRASEGELQLTTDERASVTHAAVVALRAAALAHVEDALLADYTLGNATIPASVAAGIRLRVEQALSGVITDERLRAILDLLCAPAANRQSASSETEKQASARLAAIESETRDTLRKGTREALAGVHAGLDIANAILAQLESSLTALDQTNDLNDETFRLRLHLPGALVGGNYDKLEDGAAVWEFKGSDLQDREIVLRAVSVVE